MVTKIITLIERNAADELKAYFENASNEQPLDSHEELVVIEHFHPEIVKSYINRFRFSEKAEIAFIVKAPADLRRLYINYYGLFDATQKYIVDHNLKEAALDFMNLRRFWDDDYVLRHASDAILRTYVGLYAFEGDALVLALLQRSNETLFQGYVNKGRYISEFVMREVISSRNVRAFSALMYRFYNRFKKKTRNSDDFDKVMKSVAEFALPADLQVEVLQLCDRALVEVLLRTSPLAPAAQNVLFRYNYDVQWFKYHISSLYGMGGYRFTPKNEQKLFKLLASKNLDECLTTFRHRDDVAFVQLASSQAVQKYLKDFRLSDDAQVALMRRGDADLAKVLISRYSPEYGLCWQAEVELAKIYSAEVIKAYISFHSLSFAAQDVIRARQMEDVMAYYFSLHPY